MAEEMISRNIIGTGDARYLKLDGSNANTAINIGSQSFTATSVKVGTAAGYISSDNSAGVTATVTYLKDLLGTFGTITIKDGIITGTT